jgi:hypothetical protein
VPGRLHWRRSFERGPGRCEGEVHSDVTGSLTIKACIFARSRNRSSSAMTYSPARGLKTAVAQVWQALRSAMTCLVTVPKSTELPSWLKALLCTR